MNIAAKGTEIKNGRRRSIIVKRQNFHLRKGLEDDIFENEICRCRAVNWKLQQDMLIIDTDADKKDTTNQQMTEMLSSNCIRLINVQTEEQALVWNEPEGLNAHVLRNLLPDCTLEWAHPVSAEKLPYLFRCKESAPLKRPSDVIMTHLPDFEIIESLETIWVSPLAVPMKLVDVTQVEDFWNPGELDPDMGLVDLVFHLAPICPPSSASSSASSTPEDPLATVPGDESQAPPRHPYDSRVSTASADRIQFILTPVHQGDRQEDEDMEVPHVGSAVQARLQESPM